MNSPICIMGNRPVSSSLRNLDSGLGAQNELPTKQNQNVVGSSYSRNLDGTPDKDGMSKEMVAVNDVYTKFFKKYSTDVPDSFVEIPSEQLGFWKVYLEDVLGSKTTTEGSMQKDQPTVVENPNSLIVHLLNTSDTRPAKSFSEELQEDLERANIKATEIKAPDILEQQNVLIVICNKIENETTHQAVEKCLDDIKDDQYKRIILIMLHVTRKPPRTQTRRELRSCDRLEKYKAVGKVVDMAFLPDKGIFESEINETARREIETFIFEYNSTHNGTLVTAEKSVTEINEIGATKLNTVATKNSQDSLDIPKPTAFIMDTTDSPASLNFVREFQDVMKTHGIVLTEISDCDDSKLDVFLILVCSIISRLETDVDKCLSAVSSKQYDKTILVILHVANNTQQQSDSNRTLVNNSPEKYSGILQIVDMAFTNDKGIYQCEMNTHAFKQLKKLYDSHKDIATEKTEFKARKNNVTCDSDQQLDKTNTESVPEKKKKTEETSL